MKSLLASALILWSFSAGATSIGNEGGHGGGGVNQNGVYMTFGSAGFYVNPAPELTVSGIDIFKKMVLSFNLQPENVSSLLSASLPSQNRLYYKMQTIDANLKAQLLAEYAKAINQPVDHLVVFAITDVQKKTTYLLPEFYQLTDVEQAAIIFHEAYWILSPDATYPDVISAEISFQSHLQAWQQGHYEISLAEKLGALLNDYTLALNMALGEDLRTGVLKTLGATPDGVPLKAIVANDKDDCYYHPAGEGSIWSKYTEYSLTAGAYAKAAKLSQQYPNSNFLAEIQNYLSTNALLITVDEDLKPESYQACHLAHPLNQKVKVFTAHPEVKCLSQWLGSFCGNIGEADLRSPINQTPNF